jgi:hypothetical protein
LRNEKLMSALKPGRRAGIIQRLSRRAPAINGRKDQMSSIYTAATEAVSINRAPEEVYQFVTTISNLPTWLTSFCKAVERLGDGWAVTTAEGPIPIRFVPPNAFGVMDHDVGPGPGLPEIVSNPMRVVPNGSGSEVMFTLFRRPGTTEAHFLEDLSMVRADLAALRRVMEAR